MGFIENLVKHRNQKEAKAATKVVEKILQIEKKKQFERERMLKKRAENMPQWEEAKRQFEESKVLKILKEVIDLGGAKSYYKDP